MDLLSSSGKKGGDTYSVGSGRPSYSRSVSEMIGIETDFSSFGFNSYMLSIHSP
jgi:hypothetical protein